MPNKVNELQPFGLPVSLSEAGALMAVPDAVASSGARLRLVPKPSALDAALNAASAGRWKTSRYMIGRVVYCKLSIYDATCEMWIERDAPDGGQYRTVLTDSAKAEEAGSLYNAMLRFGFFADLEAMPLMAFGANQVHIEPMAQGQRVTGYRLAARLAVADVQHGPGRQIIKVVLKDPNGGEIIWAR